MQIKRADNRSVVNPGEIATITHVYDCTDGETQIVSIEMSDRRMPMSDIVCFKDSSPLQRIKPAMTIAENSLDASRAFSEKAKKAVIAEMIKRGETPTYLLRQK
jgi:hypothetical protein